MARAALRHLLSRQSEARTLVSALEAALGGPVTVEDADGRLLLGSVSDPPPPLRVPVTNGESNLGWVAGGDSAGPVASLLTHLAARDGERKALGAEVLHLYREVNLIYSFTEKLAALLDLAKVAELTLQQARQMIVATDGAVLVIDDDTADEMRVLACFGDELSHLTRLRRGSGIIGTVAATGIGEIVNDVDQDARRLNAHTALKALIAAPLRVGERTIGVIVLGSTMPMSYPAAELKLLNTLALQTGTAIENARLFERTIQAARERERLMALHQQAELARARLESEMNLAARIQMDLFPGALPAIPGYESAARNRPARHCGGDYYDALQFQVTDGGRLLLCVADVSGKGLPAALVMSNMQATLRALLGRVPSLPELAQLASGLLFASTAPEKYVTAAFVRLEPSSGAFDFVGAGHLDNLVLRAGGEPTRLASTGPPLGLLPPGLPFDVTRETLAPGDTVVLFSDGVTDAQNAEGEEFGESRLLDALTAAGDAPVEHVLDQVFAAIDAFVGGAPQFDDITMLAVRRTE